MYPHYEKLLSFFLDDWASALSWKCRNAISHLEFLLFYAYYRVLFYAPPL